MKYVLTSLAILFLAFLSVNGQTDITPKTIRINLTVEAPSPATKIKVYNAFLTELRKIPDLQLVDDGYVYGLEIVACDIRTSTGVDLGLALSTVTTNVVACQDILQKKDGRFNAKYQVVSHAVTLTDAARLRSEAQSIVANFNRRLDPMRKIKVEILN